MEEWKTYKISEITTMTNGKKRQQSNGNIPVYGGNGIMDYCSESNCENTVIIGRVGAYCGCVYLATGLCWISDNAISIKNNYLTDLHYLFYLLKSLDLNHHHIGAAQPLMTQDVIGRIEVSIPTLSFQKQIAAILSSLDSKIELNNRINHNLEEQAQALYKSWFVDFEPFKDGKFVESELGMIPEGWRYDYIGKLPIYISDYVSNGSFASLKANVKLHNVKEYAHFIRNTDLKSETFPIYVDRHSYEFLSKSQLSGGEIIISNVGDVGSVYICPTLDGPMTLGNNVIMIKPDNELLKYYLYILFKWFEGKQLLKGITGGSAMPKFNKTDFKSLQILIPSTDVLMAFNAAIKPLFNEINTNSSTTQKLSKLRDTILPKLMSGELKINEIDC